ncbi:MAG: maleylacetoacetate isomerase [Kofleriaceae bacterium]
MKLALHNYWRSSASYRVRIALNLKNLPFEYVIVNILKQEQFTDPYVAKNPMSQVPTLVMTEDDGTTRILVQSLPILELLDEKFPDPPFLPKTPFERHHTRVLAEIINSGIQPLQNLKPTGELKTHGIDVSAWAQRYITAGLTAFAAEADKSAGKFCVGDHITLADICLVPQMFSSRRFGVDVAKFPRLLEIEQRCLELPAFSNAAPDLQPDAVK